MSGRLEDVYDQKSTTLLRVAGFYWGEVIGLLFFYGVSASIAMALLVSSEMISSKAMIFLIGALYVAAPFLLLTLCGWLNIKRQRDTERFIMGCS